VICDDDQQRGEREKGKETRLRKENEYKNKGQREEEAIENQSVTCSSETGPDSEKQNYCIKNCFLVFYKTKMF
jgi:hypothetical protein